MKVIELLNKIANGEEVPKKIQVYNDIFVLDEENKLYEHENTRTKLFSIYNGNILNYEVTIIKEDKKIEKLDQTLNRSDIGEDYYRYIMENRFKINEIIDKINSMEDR